MPLPLPDGREISDRERTRCEVYSRIVGYFRPIDQWNIGKQSEHRGRVTYRPTPAQTAEPQRRLF